MKYIVCWESKKTGKRGNGTHAVGKQVAEAWVKKLNKKHPDIFHYIEPETMHSHQPER
jgi:hypothetical protein